MKNNYGEPVIIRLPKDSVKEGIENLRVYVTNAEGRITEEAPFNGLEARLKLSAEKLHGSSKLYISQELPHKQSAQRYNERTIVQAGGYQVFKNHGASTIDINRLPASVFTPIHWFNCLVTGHINKNFVIDGQLTNLPVCNARVHICNVERIFLWPIYVQPIKRIPDWVLAELANKIKDIHKVVVKVPPIPGPGPVENQVFEKRHVQLKSLTPKVKLTEQLAQQNLQPLPDHVLNGITSTSFETIKDTLINNHELLFPYICLWPIFWHWFYWMFEEAVVTTDCNGHFQGWIPSIYATHNVYIWIEVNINGQWVTIYRPPLPCFTRWNYSCGTDINITVTDTRVTPCVCDPLPGDIVWVKRAGNSASIRNIALNASTVPSLFADARGLTKGFVSGRASDYISPFTSAFGLTVQFGDGYPSASCSHFRWKYRRIANGYLFPVGDTFHNQEGPLTKSYTYQGLDIHMIPAFFTGQYILDEDIPGGKIYKIPHVHASVDTGIASAEWNQDTTTILVDSANMEEGIFEFVIELLDGAGNVQSTSADVFQVDSFLPSPPFAASTPAGGVDAGYLFHGSDNLNPADPVTGFRFLLRLDKHGCNAAIGDAVVDNNDGTGSTTDTTCGFAQYTDKAGGNMLLRFTAEQQHRYADYSFNVYKGNSGTVESYFGQVPPPVNSKTINGETIVYQESPTLAALLGTCTQAAFSENLDVTAYHTDGSQRFHPFDMSKVAAFAIEPV